MKTLFIDVGSTFIKYAVKKNDEFVLEGKVAFPEAIIDRRATYEVPTEKIDEIVFKIFDEVAEYDVARCYIGVQMHGFVLRYPSGKLGNYISWKDKLESLSDDERNCSVDLYENGTSAKLNLALFKLMRGRADGACELYSLGSYIAWRLTGNNVAHKTDACALGLYNASSLRLVDGFEGLIFPRATHTVCSVGEYRGVVVFTPIGDHQASFEGSGAGVDDAYLLNIGTATQVCALGSPHPRRNGVEARPYFDSRRLLTVTGLVGGGKLFSDNANVDELMLEVEAALEKLPRKRKMYMGGGGARLVFDKMQEKLAPRGIECILINRELGIEGLDMISKQQRIGVMLSEVCFQNFPIILKNEGMDFVIVDTEHGSFDYAPLSGIMTTARLTGLDTIVRLPDNSRKDIIRLCDMGAGGFLLPMTNCADDIRQVVKYAKYSPIGQRGISTNRAHTLYNPPPLDEYMVEANERVKVYAQIETVAGVENIDEILSVDGVEGIFVGPNDLSCDMDCMGNNGPVKEAITKVASAAATHGKAWGIITASKDLIDHSLACGVNMISYGSEINMMKDYCRSVKKKIYG